MHWADSTDVAFDRGAAAVVRRSASGAHSLRRRAAASNGNLVRVGIFLDVRGEKREGASAHLSGRGHLLLLAGRRRHPPPRIGIRPVVGVHVGSVGGGADGHPRGDGGRFSRRHRSGIAVRAGGRGVGSSPRIAGRVGIPHRTVAGRPSSPRRPRDRERRTGFAAPGDAGAVVREDEGDGLSGSVRLDKGQHGVDSHPLVSGRKAYHEVQGCGAHRRELPVQGDGLRNGGAAEERGEAGLDEGSRHVR
mmetsp:Transcript_42495/g.128954  ORF Transcript_42495/g.128954 Transcript_42495/m.128954 type:complete len:248 (+) Transcript_42495:363-1106(+)